MCTDCWREYGSPINYNHWIGCAVLLIRVIDEDNPWSWPLHSQLGDWNLKGEWQPWAEHKFRVSVACWEAAEALCEIVKHLSVTERAAALARARGYVDESA